MFKAIHCRTGRAALDWTLRDLADKAKINWKSVARFESGENDPRVSTRDAIEQALYDAGVRFRADGSVWHPDLQRYPQDRAA